MSKRKIFYISIIFMCVMFIGIVNIFADEDVTNQGTVGATSSAILGSGKWEPTAVGIRATIVDENGNWKKASVFVNNEYINSIGRYKYTKEYNDFYKRYAYYFNKPGGTSLLWLVDMAASKLQPGYTSFEWWTIKRELKSGINLPSSWITGINSDGSYNFVNLYNYFDQKSEVVALINNFDYTYTGEEYLIIEPMVLIGNRFATAYEFGMVDNNKNSCVEGTFCWDYWSLFNDANCLFCKTMYVNIWTANPFGLEAGSGYLHTISKKGNFGIGIYKVSDYITIAPPTVKLTITKYASEEKKEGVYFTISGGGIEKGPYSTNSKGVVLFEDLPKNTTYTITETVPRHYSNRGATCPKCESVTPIGSNKVTYEVEIGETDESISIYNVKTCSSDVDGYIEEGKLTKEERIRLYVKYKKEGFDPTNLLDFDLYGTGNDLCKKRTNCKDITEKITNVGCLSFEADYGFGLGSYNNLGEFDLNYSDNDISCFDSYFTKNNMHFFCKDILSLKNNLITTGYEFLEKYNLGTFIAGKPILLRDNSSVISVTNSKRCVVYYDNSYEFDYEASAYAYVEDTMKNVDINKEVKEIMVNGESVINNKEFEYPQLSVNPDPLAGDNHWNCDSIPGGDGYLYNCTRYAINNYGLNPVYSQVGNGMIQSSNCDNCRFLGYGIISQFNQKGFYNMPFSLVYGDEEYSDTTSCSYVIDQEIIKEKFDLEFRVIDTANPFPGKTSNGRKVGGNWCYNGIFEFDLDLDSNGALNAEDSYLSKINYRNLEIVDFNKNNVIDKYEDDIFNLMVTNAVASLHSRESCSNDNLFVKAIMEVTNNSYDKKNIGPKYRIELDATSIKGIKEYNKSHSYEEYDLFCEDDECMQKFLNQYVLTCNGKNKSDCVSSNFE